jgi:hypothetical protein
LATLDPAATASPFSRESFPVISSVIPSAK